MTTTPITELAEFTDTQRNRLAQIEAAPYAPEAWRDPAAAFPPPTGAVTGLAAVRERLSFERAVNEVTRAISPTPEQMERLQQLIAELDLAPRSRTSPERDLSRQVDRFGNLAVRVQIGEHTTWANATPATVAEFFRELAGDADRCQP